MYQDSIPLIPDSLPEPDGRHFDCSVMFVFWFAEVECELIVDGEIVVTALVHGIAEIMVLSVALLTMVSSNAFKILVSQKIKEGFIEIAFLMCNFSIHTGTRKCASNISNYKSIAYMCRLY